MPRTDGQRRCCRKSPHSARYFAYSAAVSHRAGAKFFAARTDLYWGKMLIERNGPGDGKRAGDLLASAFATAVSNGYGNVERRATDALALLQ